MGTFPILRSHIGKGRNSPMIVHLYAKISDIYLTLSRISTLPTAAGVVGYEPLSC